MQLLSYAHITDRFPQNRLRDDQCVGRSFGSALEICILGRGGESRRGEAGEGKERKEERKQKPAEGAVKW